MRTVTWQSCLEIPVIPFEMFASLISHQTEFVPLIGQSQNAKTASTTKKTKQNDGDGHFNEPHHLASRTVKDARSREKSLILVAV